MKIVRNKYLPFIKGYKAINLFGVLFIKEKAVMSEEDINHEAIHTEQMKELLYIGFYLIYFFEWLWRILFSKDRFSHQADLNVSFEKEAYIHQNDLDYIKKRKHYAMWRK